MNELWIAFNALRKAEQATLDAKAAVDAAKSRQAQAEAAEAQAREELDLLMKADGLVEETIPGQHVDYRLYYSTPRGSVKADADATPDEFCKIERKPRLKEIGEHLKCLEEQGQPLPNWATIEYGEGKLTWKSIKKGKANVSE